MGMGATTTVSLRTGREMPVLGFGTWQLDNAAEMVRKAIELGYAMIDTSSDYGTQPGVGRGVKESNVPREDYYIVTKVEETDGAYERAQQNLQELGLPYVDLLLIHRPPKSGVGTRLWEGLIQSQQDGLATDIGVSNYSIEQIQRIVDDTGVVPVVNQIEWSPFGHDMSMLDYCRENNIIIQAYSPLTRGERLDDPGVMRIAGAHRKSPAQVIIRWNLQLEVVPIIKANTSRHLQENIDVFDFELSSREMADLQGLNELFSSLGGLRYIEH